MLVPNKALLDSASGSGSGSACSLSAAPSSVSVVSADSSTVTSSSAVSVSSKVKLRPNTCSVTHCSQTRSQECYSYLFPFRFHFQPPVQNHRPMHHHLWWLGVLGKQVSLSLMSQLKKSSLLPFHVPTRSRPSYWQSTLCRWHNKSWLMFDICSGRRRKDMFQVCRCILRVKCQVHVEWVANSLKVKEGLPSILVSSQIHSLATLLTSWNDNSSGHLSPPEVGLRSWATPISSIIIIGDPLPSQSCVSCVWHELSNCNIMHRLPRWRFDYTIGYLLIT